MLSNPKHGWCNVNIGDFKGSASYLEDVPFNCVDAFISYFTKSNNINSIAITFDEEGNDFILVCDYYDTYVIINRDKQKIKYIEDIDIRQLAIELLEDLERDFDAWVNWLSYDEPDEGREENLRNRIEELRELVNEF